MKIHTFRPWKHGWHRLLLVICRLGTDLPIVTINTNVSDNPKTIPFVDDTSEIVNPNFTDLEKVINVVLKNKNCFLLFCWL
jgi:hypothetical protein